MDDDDDDDDDNDDDNDDDFILKKNIINAFYHDLLLKYISWSFQFHPLSVLLNIANWFLKIPFSLPFSFPFYSGNLPTVLKHFFTNINMIHQYATKKTYYLPKIRTNYGKFSIGFLGVKI